VAQMKRRLQPAEAAAHDEDAVHAPRPYATRVPGDRCG
jgi:hypothetical protein